jgi:hypothetical protein
MSISDRPRSLSSSFVYQGVAVGSDLRFVCAMSRFEVSEMTGGPASSVECTKGAAFAGITRCGGPFARRALGARLRSSNFLFRSYASQLRQCAVGAVLATRDKRA